MKICPECGENLLDAKRLALAPGDVLVLVRPLEAPPLSPEAGKRLCRTVNERFPHNEVMVMEEGMTPMVVSADKPS